MNNCRRYVHSKEKYPSYLLRARALIDDQEDEDLKLWKKLVGLTTC